MRKTKKNGVISLVTILVIGFLGLGMILAIASLSLVGLNKNFDIKSGNQTFYTAESAVKEGIRQYQLQGDAIINNDYNFPLDVNGINSGSIFYRIENSPMGWQYRKAIGWANNDISSTRPFFRQVEATFLLNPSFAAFSHAVYSENDLTIQGNATIIGDVYSGGNIDCGGSFDIQGEASSPLPIDNDCNGNTDSIKEGVDIIPSPDIDIDFYKNEATTNGTDFYDATDGKNYLNNQTRSGIVYIEDASTETDIQNANLTGSLAVKGNLRIRGGTVITGVNNNAAVIVEGNLRITGDTTINGLIYVSGATSFSGGNNFINGSLISIGGTQTSITGSVTIDYQELIGPPGGVSNPLEPKITSWSEI